MAETTTPGKGPGNNGGGGGNPGSSNNGGGGNSSGGGTGGGSSGGGGDGPGGASSGGGGGGGTSGTNGGNGGGGGGIPNYESQRQHLKELITRKRALEKRIAAQEESIYSKETDYLENTPGGNIITGFDNYTKGTANAAASRRKTGLTDANRVFSRSSVSYNPSAEAQTPASTTHSTPGSLAPTPLSTSFKDKDKDGGASGAPTPTSATAGKAPSKKGKKTTASKASGAAAAAAAARSASAGAGEDSETDSRETAGTNKKVRTNFGASRKN